MKRIFSLISYILFIFFCLGYSVAQQNNSAITGAGVSVNTDMSSYRRDQAIQIEIKNGLSVSIFSIAASSTPAIAIDSIEKMSVDGKWIKHPVRCGYPECYIDHDFPAEIKPGSSSKFSWIPVIYKGNLKEDVAGKGTYRICVSYQIREVNNSRDWKWQQAYTNIFNID